MKALILVDIQNDFLPGGPLGVPEGNAVVPVANRLIPHFDLVVATQDWHPANHGSFATNHAGRQPGEIMELNGLAQVLWPVHCVADSLGAEFAGELNTAAIRRVFPKGTNPGVDSYSGFFDNDRKNSTGMGDYLRAAKVETLYVLGLATDYCVKATAMDGVTLGFDTYLVRDGCRGVNLAPGDVERAEEMMQAAGITLITSAAVMKGDQI